MNKKTTNKVTQCEDGNPDCFHTTEPVAHFLDTKCPSCGLLSCEEPYVHKDGCRLFPSVEEWEKEFERLGGCDEILEDWGDVCSPLKTIPENLLRINEWPENRYELDPEKVKAFIKSLLAQERERQKEIVICAAVQLHDGRVFRGHRHADCFAVMRGVNPKIEWPNDNEQGFITSKNRFVSREEGRKLQDAAGIPSASEDGYQGNTLFSEDLY